MAIEQINNEGIPPGAESDYYDVVFNNRKYPPKLLISYANAYVNNQVLDRNTFAGGINTECFNVLDKEGFDIVNKKTGQNIFFECLIDFLTQSKTNDLTTSGYLKQYKGLKTKVSFGQGVPSRVPWIALTDGSQQVSNGIYPVYLYYKSEELLILAYGISETNEPNTRWEFVEDKQTIESYFESNFSKKPARYGNSYIYKTYKLDSQEALIGLSEEDILNDISKLIIEYTQTLKRPQAAIKQKVMRTFHPLNTILYGPPGTGKTFNTIGHALSIIKGYELNEVLVKQSKSKEARAAYKKEYDELIAAGQITFVTFHQSFSYEEFVEGIKPKVNTNGDIEYNIEDGVFKKLCIHAGENRLTQNFDYVYEQYITKIINTSEEYILKTPSLSKPFLLKVNSKGNCVAIPRTETATEMTITKKMLRSYIEHGIVDDWKPYTTAIANDIKTQFAVKFETVDNTKKNFVLIIDEINRGNISKIFGELITLLEESKRIGEPEELRLKLAYSGAESGQLFGVPNNLYIIGTMNSTDRSIALIDTALRRRFTFIKNEPAPSILPNNIDGINLQSLLTTINSRIEFLLDRDHVLGHAYFIDINSKNELCALFRNKIVPLLDEHFYGEKEKVQLVLGDNKAYGKQEHLKIIQTIHSTEQRKLFGTELEGYEEKQIFRLNEKLESQNFDQVEPEMFISIYHT